MNLHKTLRTCPFAHIDFVEIRDGKGRLIDRLVTRYIDQPIDDVHFGPARDANKPHYRKQSLSFQLNRLSKLQGEI